MSVWWNRNVYQLDGAQQQTADWFTFARKAVCDTDVQMLELQIPKVPFYWSRHDLDL